MNRQKLKRNIFLNYINTFITNLNMQSSIWVLYLAYCGMNMMQIGLLEGIYHGTSILCEIPSGAMADLIGRKKSMVLSRICIAISCMIMLFSRSFWWLAASFAVQALGSNFNSGSEEALLYDSMKLLNREEEYMALYGRLNMMIEVVQAAATVAGGILAEYSYVWCYGACVVIAVLALIPVLLMTEPPVNQMKNEEMSDSGKQGERPLTKQYKKQHQDSVTGVVAHHFKTSVSILQDNPRILKVIIRYSIIFAAYTLMFFYSQQYYYNLGFNKIWISVIMLLAGAFSCLGALHSPKLYRRAGAHLVPFGTLAMAAAYLVYIFSCPALSIPAFLIASYFNSALYPVHSDTLNRLIPSEQRATLISVDSMFFSIVMILTFPIAGAAADVWGLGKSFAVLGILLLLTAARHMPKHLPSQYIVN